MLKFLLEKEFKYILRDKFVSKMVIFMPIMMMLIFPWAANQEVKNLKLCVVDSDRSSYSERLINKVNSSGYFILSAVESNNEGAMTTIEANKSDIILEIEPQFEEKLINEGESNVMISANSVNGMKGGLGLSYLTQIVRDFSTEIRAEHQPLVQSSVHIEPKFLFNPNLDYKLFMIPAIMVILLTILAGFMPALNIVTEKEMGTIEQINVSPVTRRAFILSKLIPFWIIGLIALTLCLVLVALVYNFVPVGGYVRIFLGAMLYIVTISGMGLVISNYTNTLQQSMFISFFVIMVFILMSGLFTPISSMPNWAQKLTYLNPLRYFIEVMRMIFMKGSSLSNLAPQLTALGGFAVAFNVWAVLSYKKRD